MKDLFMKAAQHLETGLDKAADLAIASRVSDLMAQAEAYATAGLVPQARERWRQVIELDKNHVAARAKLVESDRASIDARGASDSRVQPRIDAGGVEHTIARAEAAFESGDVEGAQRLLRGALDVFPANDPARVQIESLISALQSVPPTADEAPQRGVVFVSEPEEVSAPTYRKKYCLSVGINAYRSWPTLSNATNDARGVADLLRSEGGFNVRTLADQEATRDAIASSIQDGLAREVEEDDLVVIFFAGHGHTKQHPRSEKGYIVPVEARQDRLADLISMDALQEWTSYLASRHILCVFDSCFSGFLTLRAGAPQMTTKMLQRNARIAITAGSAEQTVSDGGWGSHSAFTGILMQGLRGQGALNGTLSATSLFSYLAAEVPKHSRQTPSLGMLPGHEGADILLNLNPTGASATAQ